MCYTTACRSRNDVLSRTEQSAWMFVLVFYLKVKIFLIIAKVTIQTCVSLNGVENENNLHYSGVFSQVSGFDVCTLGI